MTATLDDARNVIRNASVEKFVAKHVGSGATRYDSAVIAGNGIGALTFAARLARNPGFTGKVTVVAPDIVESRRLINGVSLRGRAADFLSAALGVSHDQMLDVMAGPGERPTAIRQTTCVARRTADGQITFSKPGTWQGGWRGEDKPLVYGVRNSRVTGGMVELMANLGVEFVSEKVEGRDHLLDYARGSAPVLVNGTTNPRLLGATVEKPAFMVLASQVPFIVRDGGVGHPLHERSTFAPIVRRDGILDVGYFTPFRDPLSPRSTWYGIVARVVRADSGFDKDRELAIITDELIDMGSALGLDPDDADETLGRALVPSSPFGAIPDSAPGTLELRRAYSGGNPCYYADGMTASAVGGVLAADSVVSGANATQVVRKALRPWRLVNYLWSIETNRIARLSDALLRTNVPVTMAVPHTVGQRLWESAA